MKLAALILSLFLPGCAIPAPAPSTQPAALARPLSAATNVTTRDVQVTAGSSRSAIQSALANAAARGLPLYVAPGTYRIDATLSVPPGLVVRSDGATLLGTQPGAILSVSGDGTVIDGLVFNATVAGVTGITGEFIRATVTRCEFWTSLTYGIDGHGLLSRITDCQFGVAGELPKAFQPIRVRSADGSTNAWEIDHCAIYHAVGDCAVEVGDGYQLDLHHLNIEQNNTRVAVKIAGMFTASIRGCWFEDNAGESQVELVHDRTDTIGNYTVESSGNFWKLNGTGNKRAYLTYGACGLRFHDESGADWTGKAIASEMRKVDVGRCWLVGSPGNAPPVVQHP
jgi:hypothetical protein